MGASRRRGNLFKCFSKELEQPTEGEQRASQTTRTGKLSIGTKLAYAMPRGATVGMVLLVQAIVRPYYIDGMGMEIGRQAMLVAICKSVDFLIGFIVGYTSDHLSHKTVFGIRFGRRSLYIMFGFPIWMVCFYLLALPPSLDSVQQADSTGYCSQFTSDNTKTSIEASTCVELQSCLQGYIDNGTLPVYNTETVVTSDVFAGNQLSMWFCAFYFAYYSIGFTLTIIPYDALGMELTDDYDDRSSLFGFKGASQFTGYLSLAGLAFVFSSMYPDSIPTQISLTSVIYVIAVTITFLNLFKRIKEKDLPEREDIPLIPSVMQTFKNRPYMIYLLLKIPNSVAGMMPVAMMPYFLKIVMREENTVYWFAVLLGIALVSAVVSVPILVHLQQRFDKARVLLWVCLIFGVVQLASTFLNPTRSLVMMVIGCAGLVLSATQVIPDALLGDIIDYDELYTGERNEGVYTIVETNLQQWIEIPAGVVPLMWMALNGFKNNGDCTCGCGVSCTDPYMRWDCREAALSTLPGTNTTIGNVGYACSSHPESSLLFGNDVEAPCTEQNNDVVWVLKYCTLLIPGICLLMAVVPIALFPITRDKHKQILVQIKKRHDGDAYFDPLTNEPILRKDRDADPKHLVDSFTTYELKTGNEKGIAGLRFKLYFDTFVILACFVALLIAVAIWPTANMVTLGALGMSFFMMLIPWTYMKLKLFHSLSDDELNTAFKLSRERVEKRRRASELGYDPENRPPSAGDNTDTEEAPAARPRKEVKAELRRAQTDMTSFKGRDDLDEQESAKYKKLKKRAKKLKEELSTNEPNGMVAL